jgi:iron complex outermembrane receptor protein
MHIKHTRLLLAGLSISALAAGAGHAQTAPADAAAETGQTGLIDIVVTGEKRETTLQTAPLSITAIGGSMLLERNINQLNDLNGYVPGLTIAKSEGAERVITIRGIGYETAQNPNSQPGVAFHIDGVYIAHVMALSQDLLDVDRIEVLRGPQGTVFGETATGGAINVITRKPVIGEFSGSGSLSYGNYNYVKAIGTINLPISDVLAARGSVQYLRHDGYGYSVGVAGDDRYDLEDADNIGYRASLLYKPTDRFTALLEGQGFYTDRNAALQKDITDTTPGNRHVNQDYPGTYRLNTQMLYLTLSQELGDWAMAKSVSAYQYMNKNQTGDNDRLANPGYFDHLIRWQDSSKTFTQEVSVASIGKQRVDWTVGAFYLRQRATQHILEVISPYAAAVVLPDGTGVKYKTDSPFQHTSWAGYANAILHLTDQVNLTAGGRYSYDKITAQPVTYDNAFGSTEPRSAVSRAFTGKIGAEYHLTPRNMVYLTGSRGYKPTGLNFNLGSLRTPIAYEKEIVDALEIGTKNDLFNNMLRLNLSGYYYWYKNYQFTAEDPLPNAGGTANIPRAEIYGIEIESSFLPMRGLRLDGSLSLARGRFKSDYLTIDAQSAANIRNDQYANVLGYYNPYDPRVIAAVDAGRTNVNGNRVPKLPGVQAQGSASYSWSLGGGTVMLRGDAVYRGGYIYRIFDSSALDQVPAYTIFNAFISYTPDEKPWSVSVSATNVTNKDGINSRFSDPYGSGTTSVEYIDPRQVFGTVSFKF